MNRRQSVVCEGMACKLHDLKQFYQAFLRFFKHIMELASVLQEKQQK